MDRDMVVMPPMFFKLKTGAIKMRSMNRSIGEAIIGIDVRNLSQFNLNNLIHLQLVKVKGYNTQIYF